MLPGARSSSGELRSSFVGAVKFPVRTVNFTDAQLPARPAKETSGKTFGFTGCFLIQESFRWNKGECFYVFFLRGGKRAQTIQGRFARL